MKSFLAWTFFKFSGPLWMLIWYCYHFFEGGSEGAENFTYTIIIGGNKWRKKRNNSYHFLSVHKWWNITSVFIFTSLHWHEWAENNHAWKKITNVIFLATQLTGQKKSQEREIGKKQSRNTIFDYFFRENDFTKNSIHKCSSWS